MYFFHNQFLIVTLLIIVFSLNNKIFVL